MIEVVKKSVDQKLWIHKFELSEVNNEFTRS